MEDDTRERLRAIGFALGLTLAGLLTGSVLSGIGLLILAGAGVEITGPVFLVVSLVTTQGIAFGGVAFAYVRYRGLGREFIPVELPSLRDLLWVVGGYVLAFGGIYAIAIVVSTFAGTPEASNRAAEIAMETPDVLLLMIPASFVLIGPGEELLFRGVVQGTLREVFSPAPAIAIASAVFAAIHFTALVGAAGDRLVVVSLLFVPALVFGTAYEKTGNIVVPALIHGTYNATLFGLLYLALKFAPEQMENAAALL